MAQPIFRYCVFDYVLFCYHVDRTIVLLAPCHKPHLVYVILVELFIERTASQMLSRKKSEQNFCFFGASVAGHPC